MTYKAYTFRLYPNQEQEVMFSKTFGCVRFIYNKMLAERQEIYAKYKDDKEKLKEVKPTTYSNWKKEFEFLKEVDSLALANASQNLLKAYKAFFTGKSKFPKFKSKHKSRLSYTTNNQKGTVRIENKKLKLPKVGFVKIKQHRSIPDKGEIKSATIYRTPTGKHYVSLLILLPDSPPPVIDGSRAIGLDFSMSSFFVDNQGNKANYPKFYRQTQEKLAKEQRKLSRCVRGSNNYAKQRRRVALVHEKIKHQRKDWLEKQSKRLADNYDVVAIEDLNMAGMSKALNFGKSVHDNGWGMFVNMLQHKVKAVVKIDKWFPSSKLCRECGVINKELTLADRSWTCICGAVHEDRDTYAAQTILIEGLDIFNRRDCGDSSLMLEALASSNEKLTPLGGQ